MLKMKKTYIHKNSIDVIGTIVALKWCYIRSVIISCKEKEGKIWWHFLEGTQCDKYGKIVQYKYEPKHLQPYYLEDIIDPKGIGIHPYKIISTVLLSNNTHNLYKRMCLQDHVW